MIHALATRRVRTSGSWCVVVNLELDLFAIAMFHFIHLRGGFGPFLPQMKKGTLQKIQMMTICLIFTLIVQIDQKQH